MFDEVMEWIKTIVPSSYVFCAGRWVESEINRNSFLCVLYQVGGNTPRAEDRRQYFLVHLLGPREDPGFIREIREVAYALADEAVYEKTLPCNATGIRLLGDVSGPMFTAEDRNWFSLTFTVIF